ncbi:MAG: 16S rRNA (uracil(1498)-N(3))-methyltransferase [Microthrixaceae bacterium]|nr:16S rRNA (uracil(1498)-N(3))-methyltransferase [Microthrixaceae bacterium]
MSVDIRGAAPPPRYAWWTWWIRPSKRIRNIIFVGYCASGPKEAICVTDGRGGWRMCSLASTGTLVVQGPVHRVDAPSPSLTVGFAALKGNRNELVVQKLTELGIDRIWLLRCDRGVVRWDDSRARRHLERLARVVEEAVAQCRCLWTPELEWLDFGDALARIGDRAGDGRPGDAPGELPGSPVLADAGGRGLQASDTTVLVGPEGGWSDAERRRASGVALGENVLRAETAAIVAGATMSQLRVGLVGPGLPSLSP